MMKGQRPIDIRSLNDDVPVLTEPSISGTSSKHTGSSRGTNEASSSRTDEVLSSTIHEKAFPIEPNDEASVSKVSMGEPTGRARKYLSKPTKTIIPATPTRTFLENRKGRAY